MSATLRLSRLTVRRFLVLGAVVQAFFGPVAAQSQIPQSQSPEVETTGTPPNFVIILVDDAALMDFGAYGGEAATPNIDALAERGVMFSRFHTSPLCAPSRAMLLTGIDNHRNGVATIPEILPASQRGKP